MMRGDKTVPAAENRIFSQEEYWGTFSVDIANAQRELLITSPYLHIAQVKRFLKLIPEETHVTDVTGNETSFKPEAWEKVSNAVKLLEDAGAKVILHPKVYQRYAVIDKSTLWYGGINFLGFEKAAHGAMRLYSAELAKELNDKINNEQEQMSLPEV
jgi:hypothetical protein